MAEGGSGFNISEELFEQLSCGLGSFFYHDNEFREAFENVHTSIDKLCDPTFTIDLFGPIDPNCRGLKDLRDFFPQPPFIEYFMVLQERHCKFHFALDDDLRSVNGKISIGNKFNDVGYGGNQILEYAIYPSSINPDITTLEDLVTSVKEEDRINSGEGNNENSFRRPRGPRINFAQEKTIRVENRISFDNFVISHDTFQKYFHCQSEARWEKEIDLENVDANGVEVIDLEGEANPARNVAADLAPNQLKLGRTLKFHPRSNNCEYFSTVYARSLLQLPDLEGLGFSPAEHARALLGHIFTPSDVQEILEVHWPRLMTIELKRKRFLKHACQTLRSGPHAEYLQLRNVSMFHVNRPTNGTPENEPIGVFVGKSLDGFLSFRCAIHGIKEKFKLIWELPAFGEIFGMLEEEHEMITHTFSPIANLKFSQLDISLTADLDQLDVDVTNIVPPRITMALHYRSDDRNENNMYYKVILLKFDLPTEVHTTPYPESHPTLTPVAFMNKLAHGAARARDEVSNFLNEEFEQPVPGTPVAGGRGGRGRGRGRGRGQQAETVTVRVADICLPDPCYGNVELFNNVVRIPKKIELREGEQLARGQKYKYTHTPRNNFVITHHFQTSSGTILPFYKITCKM